MPTTCQPALGSCEELATFSSEGRTTAAEPRRSCCNVMMMMMMMMMMVITWVVFGVAGSEASVQVASLPTVPL